MILDATGKPAGQIATDVKKEYNEKEVQVHKHRLHSLYRELFEGFKAQLVVDESQPDVVRPDTEALRKHYGERWREAARTTNASSLAIQEIDEEGIYKLIDQFLRHQKREAELVRPLHELDLDTKEFSFVAIRADGKLWINTQVAVCVSDHGNVRVYLRPVGTPTNIWTSNWTDPDAWPCTVEAIGYTLAEVHNLLRAQRVPDMAKLTEEQVDACRRDPEEDGTALTVHTASGLTGRDLQYIVVAGMLAGAAGAALIHLFLRA